MKDSIHRFDTAMGNIFGWVKEKKEVNPLEGLTRFRVKVRMPAERFKELATKSKDGSELGSLILKECMEGESRCHIIPCLSSELDFQPEKGLSTVNEEQGEALNISKKIK